jgi:hypothetical protein
MLSVAGCYYETADRSASERSGGATTVATSKPVDRDALHQRMMDVAIPVSDDYYMIPSGLDEDGCETFRPYSVNNPVKAAIHYRQADGGFGIVKDPAYCKVVEMVEADSDAEGCMRYRAELSGGAVSDGTEVPYYKTSDGNYSVRKPKLGCS